MALGYSTALRNAQLDAITTTAGGNALLRIYDGTQPATGGAPTTLLAELTCNATFAPAASGAVLTLNAITADSSADASGVATWFRIVTSGATFVMDGTAGTSGTDMILSPSASITATGNVSVSSAQINCGNA